MEPVAEMLGTMMGWVSAAFSRQARTTTAAAHSALVVNDLSYHGAQVCELRDLYRRLA